MRYIYIVDQHIHIYLSLSLSLSIYIYKDIMLSQHPTLHPWFVQLGVFFSPTDVFNGIPSQTNPVWGEVLDAALKTAAVRETRDMGAFVLMSVIERVGFADFFFGILKSQSGCFEV